LAQRLIYLPLAAVIATSMGGCGPTAKVIDPAASEKQYLLAADYFSKNMVGPATEEILKSIDFNPQNADAHNLLGLISLRKASEVEDLATRAQCLKGVDLALEKQEMDGHFKKAEDEFKQAVTLKAGFSDALNNLAVVVMHFGRYEEAIQLEEKALSNIIYREPYYAEGNLGLAYLSKKDHARAAKALRQAVFEQPGFCVGRYRLAKVYYEEKEYDHAAEELEKVTSDKACPIQEAYHLAGLVALHRQDRQRAAEMFQRCTQIAPKSCLARECTLAAN
jgi:Tfp pilus assembly protein PilF